MAERDSPERVSLRCFVPNMFLLLATVGASTSFDFTSEFFGKKHARCKSLTTALTTENFRVLGCKAFEHKELAKLFHESLIAAISTFTEAGLKIILFLVVGIANCD